MKLNELPLTGNWIPNPCVASSSLARGASFFPLLPHKNQRFTEFSQIFTCGQLWTIMDMK